MPTTMMKRMPIIPELLIVDVSLAVFFLPAAFAVLAFNGFSASGIKTGSGDVAISRERGIVTRQAYLI